MQGAAKQRALHVSRLGFTGNMADLSRLVARHVMHLVSLLVSLHGCIANAQHSAMLLQMMALYLVSGGFEGFQYYLLSQGGCCHYLLTHHLAAAIESKYLCVWFPSGCIVICGVHNKRTGYCLVDVSEKLIAPNI